MSKKQLSPRIRRVLLAVFMLVLALIILLFIPPENVLIITMFLGIVGGLGYFFFSLYLRREFAILGGIGVVLFLLTTMIVGFQILNTILLISFIIGLGYLLVK
jgi:hypothetical protein